MRPSTGWEKWGRTLGGAVGAELPKTLFLFGRLHHHRLVTGHTFLAIMR